MSRFLLNETRFHIENDIDSYFAPPETDGTEELSGKKFPPGTRVEMKQ
ncbi:MAG: hypothetical protein JW864_06550 [Spirochaetes bacterium]|nr:hypothetical protein [Spirochaetota bacterium]